MKSLQKLDADQKVVVRDIQMVYENLEKLTERVEKTENAIQLNTTKLANTECGVNKLSEENFEVKETQKGLSETFVINNTQTRPSNKHFFYTPNRLRHFVGRKYELEKLEEQFLGQNDRTFTQVICGLGGTGKTSLSVEYSWRFLHYYSGGVFWMTAENEELLQNSIRRLAVDVNTTGADTRETLFKTLRWLSLIQSQWLLVVDNVDVEDLQHSVSELILGSWKRQSKGHIIITSRREASDAEETFCVCADSCITLDILSTTESILFLRLRTGREQNNEEAAMEELVKELDGLPLALEQAAAHIKRLNCSFSQYVKSFQEQRLKLLKLRKNTNEASNKNRVSVQTTWQLNFDYIATQSEESCLGTAAVAFMELSSFLFADDIPMELANVGSPKIVPINDLAKSLKDDIGKFQIIEILTQFSLFQKKSESSISVHSLVQEVVRDTVKDEKHRIEVLQSACRMINNALENCPSPPDILEEENVQRGALQMWERIAANASTLKGYILDFSKESSACQAKLYFSEEMTRLLQTCAIYDSLYYRQDEALAAQAQMNQIIMHTKLPDDMVKTLTIVNVPLFRSDRILIKKATASETTCLSYFEEDSSFVSNNAETLREKGNNEFKIGQYQNAISFYSEAIKITEGKPDARLFSNRSLCYLKSYDFENCIRDADRCIELDHGYTKAYCWKAYAIASLIRLGQLPENWESVGLAAASAAGYLDKKVLLEYRMKIEFPLVRFYVLDSGNKSVIYRQEINSLSTYTTLLLKQGKYDVSLFGVGTKSVQVIGLDKDVEICVNGVCYNFQSPHCDISLSKYKTEKDSILYFENLIFCRDYGQIAVSKHVTAIFWRCTFSNGKKCCKAFPRCEGKSGCVSKDRSKCKDQFRAMCEGRCVVSGCPGGAGICATKGGKVYLKMCHINGCGGGGTLCDGNGSFMEIEECHIENTGQMGVEARNGGKVVVKCCKIHNCKFHGVAIGPRGFGTLHENVIYNNHREGIWCGGIFSEDNILDLEDVSNCIIKDNIIYQNGKSGISLDGGNAEIINNKVFDNWLWGIFAHQRSCASICYNDIFENECGGIRIGTNYSASIELDGNTIKDHSGPAVYASELVRVEKVYDNIRSIKLTRDELQLFADILDKDGKLVDEMSLYSRPPFLTTSNVFKNNAVGTRHPRKLLKLIQACCNCQSSKNLQTCTACHKAAYCSKVCQKHHWKKHKQICKTIGKLYVEEIDMLTVRHNLDFKDMSKEDMLWHRYKKHGINLKGIGEGCLPPENSKTRFIVKIQSGSEYSEYNPQKEMLLYDQSLTLDIYIRSPPLYHLVNECGELASNMLTTKKMYCWASFKQGRFKLCIHTDSLPPFQTW